MHPSLYKAARSGDVDSLRRIRGQNAALLFKKTPKDSSILHIAAEFDQLDFFEEAVHLCPKSLVKHANSRGDIALHSAAREGSVGVVRFIINLNYTTELDAAREVLYSDVEVLYSGIEEGHQAPVEGYKELLRMVNRDGDNALHLAAQYGHYEVAKLLVEADPELSNIVNNAKESPCFMATIRNESAIVELLLRLNPSSSLQAGANGMTVLHTALFTSNDIVEKIVHARPEVIRESDAIGWTPLHYAAASDGRVDAVEFFLKHDPLAAYLVGKEGESALHITAFNGSIEVMKVLVDTHPDCWDLLNNKGQTALHAAVLGEKPDVVEYIIGFPGLKSFDRIADEDGNTPLHLAAMCKHKVMITTLCKGKNSYEIRSLLNKQNLTALDICGNGVEGFLDDGLRVELQKTIIGLQHRRENKIIMGLKDSDLGKDEGVNVELLQVTATLVATVTFSAGFTMPGGYNQSGDPNEGMAVLASKTAFQAFLIFDIIAFIMAIMVVFLQFIRFNFNTRKNMSQWVLVLVKYSERLLGFALLAMGLAFACGLYVTLAKTPHLGLAALILSIVLIFYAFSIRMLSRIDAAISADEQEEQQAYIKKR